MKGGFYGEIIMELAALRLTTYNYLIDDNDGNKKKSKKLKIGDHKKIIKIMLFKSNSN